MNRTNILKRSLLLLPTALLFACSSNTFVPDYPNAATFEIALNNGEDTKGKTVCFTVDDYKPDSPLGYNIWAGEHLNFISETDPGVKIGDSLTVKVKEATLLYTSWIVTYEKI